MSENRLSDYVARVRAYLHSPEGRRNVRHMMAGYGWPYERAVAESVMRITRLVHYERIEEVADEVIVLELGEVSA